MTLQVSMLLLILSGEVVYGQNKSYKLNAQITLIPVAGFLFWDKKL